VQPTIQSDHENKPILLVDDDVDLCELMTDFFAEHGITLEAVHDGGRGLARAMEGSFALIILDVMLPVLDGFEVLRQLRRRTSVPVIMLTARTEQRDRIAGLDAGADDYLPKPFGPDELLARIRAVLRRAGQPQPAKPEVITLGDLRVNPSSREVWARDRAVEMTSTEFDILDCLVRSSGRIISRDELSAVLYQRPSTPFERALDVHVSHLRKKIEGAGVAIRTVRGVGYVLTPGSDASE
jgi:two-component system response regulator CpxR